MEQELIKYGLSGKEAKVYLLCLKTGETTANRLIELSALPRGTAYDILEKLKIRGLISSIIKEKTTYYSTNDPDILLKEIEEKKASIKQLIPKLKKLNETIPKQLKIEIYEGLSGSKKILDDILENAKEVVIMGNETNARKIILHQPENFRLNRISKKIKIRNLLELSPTSQTLKNDAYSLVKHTPALKESMEVLIIYNNTTVHLIMQEPITIIKITSEEYTKTQRTMFDNLWKIAKK